MENNVADREPRTVHVAKATLTVRGSMRYVLFRAKGKQSLILRSYELRCLKRSKMCSAKRKKQSFLCLSFKNQFCSP